MAVNEELIAVVRRNADFTLLRRFELKRFAEEAFAWRGQLFFVSGGPDPLRFVGSGRINTHPSNQ